MNKSQRIKELENKVKKLTDKLDEVRSETFGYNHFLFSFGTEDSEKFSHIQKNRENIKTINEELETLRKVLFKYLGVELVTSEIEYIDEDGDECKKKEIKLVEVNKK